METWKHGCHHKFMEILTSLDNLVAWKLVGRVGSLLSILISYTDDGACHHCKCLYEGYSF
jgi:hypothetical protein